MPGCGEALVRLKLLERAKGADRVEALQGDLRDAWLVDLGAQVEQAIRLVGRALHLLFVPLLQLGNGELLSPKSIMVNLKEVLLLRAALRHPRLARHSESFPL